MDTRIIVCTVLFLFLLSIHIAQSQLYTTLRTSTRGYGSYNTVNPCVNVETPPLKWTKENIPNPQADTCKCGRKGKPSWVCDPNNLMTYEQANQIDAAIEKLRKSTGQCHCENKKCAHVPHDYGGYQAAAVVLSALYVKPGDSVKETADDVTDHLRDEVWEYGACNDDLVILISDHDRVVYTATGDLTTEIVTKTCVDQITQNNKKDLSEKRYAQALVGMIEEYTQALNKEHPCNKPMSPKTLAIVLGVLGVGVGACAGIGYFCKRRCGGCPGGGGGGGGGAKYHAGRRGSHDSHHSHKSASSGGGGDTF